MADAIRFMLASDLMLGRPLRGVTQWPDECHDDIVDAPYRTLQNLITSSIERSVSFVLFAGNVFDFPHASPRAIRFFFEQVNRLAKHNTPVIWVEGKEDRFDDWPIGLPMPDNLTKLTRFGSDPYLLKSRGRATVLVVDLNEPDRTHAAWTESNPSFVVGVNTTGRPPETLGQFEADFVALGGRANFRETKIAGVSGAYSGGPQPRSPGQQQDGIVLDVQLRPDRATWSKVPVAAVRFFERKLEFDIAPKLETLKERAGEQCLELSAEAGEAHAIVRWTIEVPVADFAEMETEQIERELVNWLRAEFGNSSTRIWSDRVTLTATGKTPASWIEEDTILGDFLRALRDFESDDDRSWNFPMLLTNDNRAIREQIGDDVTNEERERILLRVREQGVRLLRG